MPLFDYQCRGCSHVFEHLTRPGEPPVCPKCNGSDVEKQFSMFSVGAPSLTPAQKEHQLMERAGWVPARQIPPDRRRR